MALKVEGVVGGGVNAQKALIAVRQGLRFLRAELPIILSTSSGSVSAATLWRRSGRITCNFCVRCAFPFFREAFDVGGGRCGVRRRSTEFCGLGSRTGNRGQSVAKGYDASSAAGTLIIEKNCSSILRMKWGGNVSRLSR